jgi:ferredoxin
MPIVKFIKEKKEIEVAEGANLRTEAVKAGINLNQGVNGIGASVNKYVNCSNLTCGLMSGSCGTCRVLITKGMENTNGLTTKEWLRFKTPIMPDPIPCLAYVGHEDTMRLACCTKVMGDIEVQSGPELNLFGENFFS